MALTASVLILKGLSTLGGKMVLDIALEYYIKGYNKNITGHVAHHIDEICCKDEPNLSTTYLSKTKGYYSDEETLKRLEAAESKLATDIKELINILNEEHDFIIIDIDKN